MPHPELSRECIRDTYLYKRDRAQWARCGSLAHLLYNANMRILRSGQLAPYAESHMQSNRILDRQTRKRSASEIVIVMRYGRIEQVRSTNPCTTVHIADYDAELITTEDCVRLNDVEERATAPDMHIVYEK